MRIVDKTHCVPSPVGVAPPTSPLTAPWATQCTPAADNSHTVQAIVECFGALALIQRCQEHKRRNVIEHLQQELHASVGRAMRDAWDGGNAELAKKQLQRLGD
jgi:hypothetical protein